MMQIVKEANKMAHSGYGFGYSYFYGSDLYVMYPDTDSVNTAKEKIAEIMGG